MEINIYSTIEQVLESADLPVYRPYVALMRERVLPLAKDFSQAFDNETAEVVAEIKSKIAKRTYKAEGFLDSIERFMRDSGLPEREVSDYQGHYEPYVFLSDKTSGERIDGDEYKIYPQVDGNTPYKSLARAQQELELIINGVNKHGISPLDLGFGGDPDVDFAEGN